MRHPSATLLALLLCGCDAPSIHHAQPSLFLFQTRDELGAVVSKADPPATSLFLEPESPDAIDGRGGPLLRSDRSGALTLAEWAAPAGSVEVRCRGEVTEVDASLDGLVAGGVYTSWVIATLIPLSYGSDRQPTYLVKRDFVDRRFIVTLGPAGAPDGSDSTFRAGPDGTARLRTQISALVGGQTGCLTKTPYWHLVFDYHADGQTYGPLARPERGTTEQAAHLGFIFTRATPERVTPP